MEKQKQKQKTLLVISVQEVMDQSGYHLNYRVVEFCFAKDTNVHCRWNAKPITPRDQARYFS